VRFGTETSGEDGRLSSESESDPDPSSTNGDKNGTAVILAAKDPAQVWSKCAATKVSSIVAN